MPHTKPASPAASKSAAHTKPPAPEGLAITYKPLGDLRRAERNPRTHSAAQIEKIKRSLMRFGWTNSLLIADGTIIAGHGRYAAALELAAEGKKPKRTPKLDMAPTVDLSHLNARERQAYILADNRIALDSGWDMDLLAGELEDLKLDGFDLLDAGFEMDELGTILNRGRTGETEPDETPDPPAFITTLPGDVWLLGDHRLVCGDCTDALVVANALGGHKPHLMVTDPPYGVEYDAAWRSKPDQAASMRHTGKTAAARVSNDHRADWREAWEHFGGDVAYVWHGDKQASVVTAGLQAGGFELRNTIIWAKSRLVIGRGHYHPKHEACAYMVRKGRPSHWAGDRKQTTVWELDAHHKSETGHSTQKPVECMLRAINNSSRNGTSVYDPFVGSGTTIVAAEMSGRIALTIEIDPSHVDVALIRWQKFSGKNAILESTAQTYAELAAERAERTPEPVAA
jgi:DNA modification methylase